MQASPTCRYYSYDSGMLVPFLTVCSPSPAAAGTSAPVTSTPVSEPTLQKISTSNRRSNSNMLLSFGGSLYFVI
jgi:hypothetical protein